METEETLKSVEITTLHTKTAHSPKRKSSPAPSISPGVLQLGRIQIDQAIEIEAFRLIIPKSAITHTVVTKQAKSQEVNGHGKAEVVDCVTEPWKQLSEMKSTLEKLKNSERRLLQDKEGLSNQLKVQTEVSLCMCNGIHLGQGAIDALAVFLTKHRIEKRGGHF